ncbi:putative E3 ubiquitin-protein ligase HIP1 [Sesamum angolense]|uniref:RING-type E3 ubiquitin transferase n=1 Tax=Sesamum angolense TaxID=2727404 RepID=A0AAE1XD59_9LAMI|nr:putative E3 ubiquitin-protein ligase HIP1 [Sesamum angolense]
MVTPEDNPFLESETAMGLPRIRSDVSGSRHHRHIRHGFREGLAEIVMLQNSLLMGGRLDGLDRYRELRLDLITCHTRIGYVSTGLREDEIACCLRRTKLAMLDDLPLHFASEMERKCSICQEEYELDDELGKLNCGHFYHIDCIRQWLGQKNTCPICKTAAVSQTSDK